MSERLFLERIHIGAFGRFSDTVIGPFTPGLNVVYGKNESGKTTTTAFVGGVLFGWDDARGKKNVYKPPVAERYGSLLFRDAESGASVELSRHRNAEGLLGAPDERERVMSGLDKDTFATVFSLNSDELRNLEHAPDMTSQLLTAGSGTSASPAHILDALDARIASYTSRSVKADHSFVHLQREADDCRARMAAARAEADEFKEEDREYRELSARLDEMEARLSETNERIESLSSCKSELESLEQQLNAAHEERCAAMEAARAEHAASAAALEPFENVPAWTAEHRTQAQSAIAELEEERAAVMARVQSAREAHAAAQAHYEVLRAQISGGKKDPLLERGASVDGLTPIEDFDFGELVSDGKDSSSAAPQSARPAHGHKASMRKAAFALVAAAALFALAGVGIMAAHSAGWGDIPAHVGIGLSAAAGVLMLAVLILIAAGRSASPAALSSNAGEGNGNPAHPGIPLALVEQARLSAEERAYHMRACESDYASYERRAASMLYQAGLAEAGHSLRHANMVLARVIEACRVREQCAERCRAVDERETRARAHEESLVVRHASLCERMGNRGDVTPASLEDELAALARQRDALLDGLRQGNARCGQLSQILASAERANELDMLKMRRAQIVTRHQEAAEDFTRLLLARRMLASALSAWEGKSQPEVYARASSLLSLMTEGTWVRVAVDSDGDLEVCDEFGRTRPVRLLSMGTCQQLYLALRIALLECVPQVGAAVPVLADDILVNFDDDRRAGAVRALAELARKHQVIVFTCHREVVEAFKSHGGEHAVLAL